MDQALLTAAAGMKAEIETLEMLSNNVANASTPGYKADREFHRLFLGALSRRDPVTGDSGWMPVVHGAVTDFRQGALEATDSPFDVALEGPGFLAVRAGAAMLYSRGGSLRRGPGGELETVEGAAVLDPSGARIVIPGEGRIEIAENGTLSVAGIVAGKIGVFEFADPGRLTKAGANMFQAPEGVDPATASSTLLRQGVIESSNVNPVEAAVRLITVSRGFEMLRRAATLIGDEMDRRAVETLGRTG